MGRLICRKKKSNAITSAGLIQNGMKAVCCYAEAHEEESES
jgi:hypothetical protein